MPVLSWSVQPNPSLIICYCWNPIASLIGLLSTLIIQFMLGIFQNFRFFTVQRSSGTCKICELKHSWVIGFNFIEN